MSNVWSWVVPIKSWFSCEWGVLYPHVQVASRPTVCQQLEFCKLFCSTSDGLLYGCLCHSCRNFPPNFQNVPEWPHCTPTRCEQEAFAERFELLK